MAIAYHLAMVDAEWTVAMKITHHRGHRAYAENEDNKISI